MKVPIEINAADLADKKHPNDRGYKKMADAWFLAILEADRRSWLKDPASVNLVDLPGKGFTGTNSAITLINGVSFYNVLWVVGSSMILNT